MARRYCVGANWKMNGNRSSIVEMCKMLNKPLDKDTQIIVACPSVYIWLARSMLPCRVSLAGQNAYKVSHGAFTGEISPSMLKDVGADWVILGHSERRQIFYEKDELIAEKCAHALASGLGVIACIGETYGERLTGKTNDVVAQQMAELAYRISNWTNVKIAYEPIWAIGGDKAATPQQAQEVHSFLRQWVADHISKDVAKKLCILYGGSVCYENCKGLIEQPDIDGFLVGGASLKPELIDIINVQQELNSYDHSHNEAREHCIGKSLHKLRKK